ncbi:hypothetical protein ACH5RR_019703 [Cinchona calisaya]|uniref:Scarecrow-like protein 8 n=1 Tax=Cinchona calisaya TaxID=153742 RepID=A0ABD2ZR09_9GENT
MSSGFSGGGRPEYFTGSGITTGRSTIPMMPTLNMSMNVNNPPPQLPNRSALAGILPDPAAQMVHRGPDLIGKRSLAEFQYQHQLLQQQQQQQMGGLGGLYSNLRNVKSRVNYQHTSPISPLSPVDLSVVSSSLSPEISSISNSSSPMNPRHGLPIFQQFRPQQQQQQRMSIIQSATFGGIPNKFLPSNINSNSLSFPNPNLLQNQRGIRPMGMGNYSTSQQLLSAPQDQTEKKMMNWKLQELEKQLLEDDFVDNSGGGGGGGGDAVSVVTNSEWSDTIHNLNLITTNNKKVVISPSPTSSSSSCSSTSASPPIISSPKQSVFEVATAISEGRMEAATEILTRLSQVSNTRGTSEQRLTAYMTAALRSRVNPTDYPPPVSELYNKEHTDSTQMLYDVSPCFKLGFMAANLGILNAISGDQQQLVLANKKLHVIDFDIGRGGQYVHLLHALAKNADNKPSVFKITTFVDFGGEEKLKNVCDGLKALAHKIGVSLSFNIASLKIGELSRDKLGIESDEFLAVNFAFKLYKLPDESVTTENLRDELLRRVKGLSPEVVTVVEQEMNANTAPFVARVTEACGYYGVLFDSLDATVPRDNSDRLRIEEGLGRKIANSVACEGMERVERCEVFGKWRARLSMAGFEPKPMSPLIADSLRDKLNPGTRGNPGFTVNEQSGGISFGWMGRTLSVTSTWR